MTLEQTKVLHNYSAGSAMVHLNGKLYLMGDDMGYMLIMDTAFNVLDSVPIVDSVQSPMPKPVKPDIEALTLVKHNGADAILLIGSGSLDPYRDSAWLLDVQTRQKTSFDLQSFYNRLKAQGLNDLNIEGLTTTKNGILLSARGNKTKPLNHLILTSGNFWDDQQNAPITVKVVSTGGSEKGAFSGVSGLEYSQQSDCLILVISTEDTKNSYDDGTIGPSYLWLVHHFSQKSHDDVITPDRIIDLAETDHRFKGQKLESACIVEENANEMILALAADNDDHKTALFKIRLKN